MKTLVLIALLAVSAIGVRAGDLWQWAPGHTTWTEHHVPFVLLTKGATSDQNVPAD
jgi:hypothetical protein